MHQGKRRFGMNPRAANPMLRFSRVEGGANPRVKENADKAEIKSVDSNVPWIFAKLYQPSPIVNTDQSRNEGAGMISRVYIPVSPEAKVERGMGDKFTNWFLRGRFE